MRILIINSEYPPIGGGAGNASANLAREMTALGHEITVLTTSFAGLPADEWLDGVHVLRKKALRRELDRSSALEQIVFMVSSCFYVLALLPKWRPDVIVAFFGIPSGLAAWCANIFAGIPYLISLRGGDVPGFRPYDFAIYHRLAAPLIRLIWRRAAMLVANSEGLKVLARDFDAKVPIQVISNGVDLKRFTPGPRNWESARLLLVSRLVYQKGIDILLEALAGLKDTPWKLVLVGDGPERQDLMKLAAAYAISERVHFKNWLHGSELLDQYQQANIFVFPSRHEGMPNAVLEAMACGLPVVATRIAGNEELVMDGQNGCLVAAEDAAALRESLRDLLADPAKQRQWGAASRRSVEEDYSWQRIAEDYLALLEKALPI